MIALAGVGTAALGLLVLVGWSTHSVPLSVDGRFAGFIVAVFQAEQWLEVVLVPARTGYGIAVFLDKERVGAFPAEADEQAALRWSQETDARVSNVTWQVRVWPTPALLNQVRSRLPQSPWS